MFKTQHKSSKKTNGEDSENHQKSFHVVPKKSYSVKEIGFIDCQGKRDSMEDGHAILDNFGGKEIKDNEEADGFFGVYDGHGSRGVVEVVEEKVHEYFKEGIKVQKKENLERNEKSTINYKKALVYAYKKTQYILSRDFHDYMSGSTACNAFFTTAFHPKTNKKIRKMFTANIGDSRVVLCRKGKAIRLTVDHKPTLDSERERILRFNGLVSKTRTFYILAVSRAFGDSSYKKYVLSDPYLSEVNLCGDDEFVILACDGLWDILEDQEAVDLCKGVKTAQEMAEKLMIFALPEIYSKKVQKDIGKTWDQFNYPEFLIEKKNREKRGGSNDNVSIMVLKL